LWLASVATLHAAEAPERKPNILVIVADDLGFGDIGVHGGKSVPTPHIDALAAGGVRCTNGYVAAPYCSPSRAGFLTGRYPTRFGHEFNPHEGDTKKLGLPLDQRTIADRLRGAGYATGLVGKWHQGFSAAHHPQSRGFDDYYGFLVGGHNYLLHKDAEAQFGSAYSFNMIYRSRELQKLDGYTTDLFTDEALAFIDRHTDKPWFLYLAYNAVHTPLEVLQKYGARVPASVTDPERRGYLSLLVGLDDALGRLGAHLRKTGHDKDTLVFFFSDNGGSGRWPYLAYNTALNTPLRGDKGQTLEGGIHVPFFVSWPGKLPAGKVYEQPVTALDILPTACAAAGAKRDGDLDGVDLLPHLKGENSAAPHEALYWRFGPQKAIRQGRWKLVDWRDFKTQENSGWQLYDLEKDISEKNDLAKEQPDRVAELSAAWNAWNARNVVPLWHGGTTEDPNAPALDHIAAAAAFVAAQAKGDFAAAMRDFDDVMLKASPADKMEAAWEQVQKQVGPFQKQLAIRQDKAGKYDAVYVTCQFEKMALDVRVVFTREGRITGYSIRPVEKKYEFKPPTYARKESFRESDVTVGSGEWALPGTLTLPAGDGPFAAVVLVQGSGAHDRDETIGPNKPFRDLAWGLASQGIAVLRYEKRNKQHAIKMVALKDKITIKEEVVDDAVEAAALLRTRKEIDKKCVFVLGHSLGALVGPLIGTRDPDLAGLILLAGNTRPLEDVILDQIGYILSLGGDLDQEKKDELEKIKKQVLRVKDAALTPATPASELPLNIPAAYWLSLRDYRPMEVVSRFQRPVLVLQGERDYQVVMADFEGWKRALSGRKDVTLKSYAKLNHLFMDGEGKAKPAEYDKAGHVAQEVVDDIARWIKAR
jgi:arylsulfatase A-like enzyme/dienelactone hydrolase